jgi:hypothetical protein
LTLGLEKETRGVTWTVLVEPARRRRDRLRFYGISARWLALLRPGGRLRLQPFGARWHTGLLHHPEVNDFVRAVVGVCANPAGLLRGPLETASAALLARSRLRLSDRSGVFRGFDGELVDGPAQPAGND